APEGGARREEMARAFAPRVKTRVERAELPRIDGIPQRAAHVLEQKVGSRHGLRGKAVPRASRVADELGARVPRGNQEREPGQAGGESDDAPSCHGTEDLNGNPPPGDPAGAGAVRRRFTGERRVARRSITACSTRWPSY